MVIRNSVLVLFSLALILMIQGPTTTLAKVEKKLSINSQPEGAEVYLVRGRKETLIGTTPFTANVSFHSDKSVIRMAFLKKGYNRLVLKVNAGQDKVKASLESQVLAVDPATHQNPRLRKIQEKLNPVITQNLLELMEKPDRLSVDLAAPIEIKEADGRIFIELPFTLIGMKDKLKGPFASRNELLVQKLWDQIGKDIALPLAKKIRGMVDIDGILLDVQINKQALLFNVKHKVETKVEQKCVGGYRYEPVIDFYGNSDTVAVYYPCIRKETVVRREVKIDPVFKRKKGQATVQYFLSFNMLDKELTPEKLFQNLGISYTDAKGKELISRGNLPFKKAGLDLFRSEDVLLLLDKSKELSRQKKYSEAISVAEQALKKAEEAGVNEEKVFFSLYRHLGNSWASSSLKGAAASEYEYRQNQGMMYHRRAYKILVDFFGADHPKTLKYRKLFQNVWGTRFFEK